MSKQALHYIVGRVTSLLCNKTPWVSPSLSPCVSPLVPPPIPGSDFQNGIVGFSRGSLVGQTLDEDSENRTAQLVLQRQENR